jgi:hypothetical protein
MLGEWMVVVAHNRLHRDPRDRSIGAKLATGGHRRRTGVTASAQQSPEGIITHGLRVDFLARRR